MNRSIRFPGFLIVLATAVALGQPAPRQAGNRRRSDDCTPAVAAVPNLDDLPDLGGSSGCSTQAVWCWTHDKGTPGSASATSTLVRSPSLDGQSRQFVISTNREGGLRTHIYDGRTHLDPGSTAFAYHIHFQINSMDHVTHLEFDHNQVLPNRDTIIYGTQMNFRVNKWDYTTNVGGASRWNHSNIAASKANIVVAPAWNDLTITYHRDDTGLVTYDSVDLNGTETEFSGASGPSNFALHDSPVGAIFSNFQVDGDSTAATTTVYLDEFSVAGNGTSCGSALAPETHPSPSVGLARASWR
ncbi:MAG: hypothetical protein ACRD20_09345 [Terriglobales bacterium]